MALRSIKKRLLLTLALAAVAALAAPSLAGAYSTHITSPAPGPLGPNYLTYSLDTGTTFDVEGTTDLADTDTVDIACYYGDASYGVDTGVDVQGGHFSDSDLDLSILDPSTCTLRAIKTGDAAPDFSTATGPVLGVGDYDYDNSYLITGGPNSGKHFGFFEWQAGTQGQSALASIGDCGLEESYAVDSTYAFSQAPLFNCAGYFAYRDNAGSRSLLRIDGANAFLGAQIGGSGGGFVGDQGSDEPNLPNVEFTRTQDAATGNVVVQDNEGVVTCSSSTARSPEDCTDFQDAHVRISRTVQIDHDGRQHVVTDVLTSTDGRAHSFDGIYSNETGAPGPGAGWLFPGETSYSTHAEGQSLAVPAGAPQSVLVRYDPSSDAESVDNPRGAITSGSMPSSYGFLADGTLGIGYVQTVPAAGSLVIKQAFSTTHRAADLTALRVDAEDRASAPTLTITSPADGARIGTPTVAVRGVAVDVGGVRSLTVNGAPVGVAPDGAFATTVALKGGANQITALATDGYGNTATKSITVTFSSVGDLTAPRITKAKLNRKKFRVGKKATATAAARRKKAKSGTKVTYTLSEDATVAFAISRESKGRRSGKKCRKATRKLRRKKSCTLLKLSGTLRRRVNDGKRSLTFTGRIGRKALKSGRYRMVLTATDAAGNRSKPVVLKFRVVKR